MGNPKCFRPRTGLYRGFQALRSPAATACSTWPTNLSEQLPQRTAPARRARTRVDVVQPAAAQRALHVLASLRRESAPTQHTQRLAGLKKRTRMCLACASSACSLSVPVRPARNQVGGAVRSQPDHGSDERAQRRSLHRLVVQPRQERGRHRTAQLPAALASVSKARMRTPNAMLTQPHRTATTRSRTQV